MTIFKKTLLSKLFTVKTNFMGRFFKKWGMVIGALAAGYLLYPHLKPEIDKLLHKFKGV